MLFTLLEILCSLTEIVSAICIITSVVMLELSNKLVYSYMVYLRYIGFSSVVSFVIILKYSINCLLHKFY